MSPALPSTGKAYLIDLMIMLMLRNDQWLTLYRRRTQLARTASPPAA